MPWSGVQPSPHSLVVVAWEQPLYTISPLRTPIFKVMCSSNVMLHTLSDGTHSLYFHIPWTKATREQGADVILTAHSDCLCLCAAVLNHFMVNNNIPPGEPLFSYKLPHGHHCPLTKQDFLSFVNKIWFNASLLHINGHGFRISGAVEFIFVGVPPEVVAAMGGWTSLAFILYWQCLKEILAMSTAHAYK